MTFLSHTRLPIIWALFIMVLCGIPGHDIPSVSFLELLNFDKFVHASLFFVLVILLTRGFLLQKHFLLLHKSPRMSALIICIVYGGLLEILQGVLFIERSADVYDFIANSFGSILGCVFFNKITNRFF